MVEANKEAVIAIQGGGVYALSLLGQARAVLEHGYVPLAFAGTSGGAILACLLWSGLSPRQIQAEFTDMVKADPSALVKLLAQFEPPPDPEFNFASFVDLQAQLQAALRSIPTGEPDNAGLFRKAIKFVPNTYKAAGKVKNLWRLWRLVQPHIPRRGLFRGSELEGLIERLIRKGFGEIAGMPPVGDPITFGKVFELMKLNPGFYRAPLLLTATNLSRRRLELISSVDPHYLGMSIAAAVRASAGFPIFFRPWECLVNEWFVDGGVISNFPIWTFSDAFRHQVARSEFYSTLAWRPWVRIGLRVVDDVVAPDDVRQPGVFLRAIVGMLTGAARNQLEEVLAGLSTRSIVIRQPTSNTAGPGVLAVGAVTEDVIGDMVQRGYDEAQRELACTGAPGVYKPDRDAVITARLKLLVDKCQRAIGTTVEAKFRANIFIPVQNSLRMVYSYNMEGDSDKDLVFPSLSMGVTGACYQLSTALVCNLAKVARLRLEQPDTYKALFEMPAALQDKVKKDRTWLMSTPIFDPQEVRVVATRTHAAVPVASALGMCLRGPVLGVLNLDAAWDYEKIELNPDSDVHSGDVRIRAIADIMQAQALTIGPELAT